MENLLGTREIITERLILRKFYSLDLTDVCQNLIHDRSASKLFWGDEYASTSNINSYFDRLQNLYSKPYFFLWAIQLRDDERLIGFIRADYNQIVNSAKLSFALELSWQNHGYMKEAISAVIQYLMEEVQINRIEAFCDNQHRMANKVLIRCGFIVEGIKRQAGFSNGKIVDLISFAILKETYMRIKEYENINIDDLWITNYRENGGEHLKNIMRLPKNEAVKLASQLSSLTTSGNDRYGYYFERYYEKRQKTEEWLYAQFQKHGGNPQTKHPIYFVLCDSSSLERFYG
ncbi:MAG TPA: GNAT family protein [Oscillospiraceae bacterium]|nr:GNAT family protein [Oscillospiraceae bacterium]